MFERSVPETTASKKDSRMQPDHWIVVEAPTSDFEVSPQVQTMLIALEKRMQKEQFQRMEDRVEGGFIALLLALFFCLLAANYAEAGSKPESKTMSTIVLFLIGIAAAAYMSSAIYFDLMIGSTGSLRAKYSASEDPITFYITIFLKGLLSGLCAVLAWNKLARFLRLKSATRKGSL